MDFEEKIKVKIILLSLLTIKRKHKTELRDLSEKLKMVVHHL